MSGLTLSDVEFLCTAQVVGCKTGLSYLLWISHLGEVSIGACVNLLNG